MVIPKCQTGEKILARLTNLIGCDKLSIMRSILFQKWKEKELTEGRVIKPYEIAKITGLHPQTVDRILNGTSTRIDIPKVDLVCQALGVESDTPIFYYEVDN